MTMGHGGTPAPAGNAAEGASQRHLEPDRPWLRRTAVPASTDKMPSWRRAAELIWRPTDYAPYLATEDTGGLTPGISVIMPSYCGRAHIGRALQSLVEQTLDPGLFEIIVILNGPPDGTRDILLEFRPEHPKITLRIVQMSRAGASRAWNAGIAAASRQYTTFVDDDDYVSPSFLEVLLAHSGPRVVAIGTIVDVTPDGELNDDNYISRGVAPFIGERTPATAMKVATSNNAPKAVATKLIKNIYYPVHIVSGMDVVFWTTLVVRHRVDFYPCRPEDGAIYYRSVRDNSMSRQTLSFNFNVVQRLDVIAELDRLLGEGDDRIQDLVLDRVYAQVAFIRKYLDKFPQEHARFVETLDQRPIANFPYGRVNGDRARGLAVAYAFPPYSDTSAIVTAKRIRARGQIVDVVYNEMSRIRDTDESLLRISGPFVGRQAVLATPTYFANWDSMEKFAMEGLRVIGKWEAIKGRYSWVYSRAQFAASHFLAAGYKLENPQAKWIAEFSDPLSRDVENMVRGSNVTQGPLIKRLREGMTALGRPVPSSLNCFVWCEELAYALADELHFTNVNQLEYMLSYCANSELRAIARDKSVIAPQPTLSSDFYNMARKPYLLDAGKTHLAYFGNFYATRGLDDVLVAIAQSEHATRERIRLHVFTTKPDSLRLRADELGVSDCVLAGPYVRYLEFLYLTTRFDCLIVNDATTAGTHHENPYLPSKWADYRGSATPVWGLVEPGSPLSREHLGYVSPVGDVSAAREILAQLVRRGDERPDPRQVVSPGDGTLTVLTG